MGAAHLVSRGLEFAYEQAGNREEFELDIPQWFLVLTGIFLALHFFAYLAINYAFGLLVPVLTMVEAPSATAVVRTQIYHDDESPDAPLLSKEEKEIQKPTVDEEVTVIATKPITSKLRTLFVHLRQETGSKRAHWRGVGGFIIYYIATAWAMNLARAVVPFRVCSHLLHIPVAGALCLLSTAWIQQLVAKPGKSYFQRVKELVGAGSFKQLVFPVMAVEMVETAVVMLPRQLAVLFGGALDAFPEDNQSVKAMTIIGLVVSAVFILFTAIFVVIPLNIGLIRLQASLLSEDTETVVPMDRTLNGAEKKNIKTAWKSFTREGRHLLVKNYFKFVMIQFAWCAYTVFLLCVYTYLALGSDAIKAIRKEMEKAQHRMML